MTCWNSIPFWICSQFFLCLKWWNFPILCGRCNSLSYHRCVHLAWREQRLSLCVSHWFVLFHSFSGVFFLSLQNFCKQFLILSLSVTLKFDALAHICFSFRFHFIWTFVLDLFVCYVMINCVFCSLGNWNGVQTYRESIEKVFILQSKGSIEVSFSTAPKSL